MELNLKIAVIILSKWADGRGQGEQEKERPSVFMVGYLAMYLLII